MEVDGEEGNTPPAARMEEPMDVGDGSDVVRNDMEEDRGAPSSVSPGGSPPADGAPSQSDILEPGAFVKDTVRAQPM